MINNSKQNAWKYHLCFYCEMCVWTVEWWCYMQSEERVLESGKKDWGGISMKRWDTVGLYSVKSENKKTLVSNLFSLILQIKASCHPHIRSWNPKGRKHICSDSCLYSQHIAESLTRNNHSVNVAWMNDLSKLHQNLCSRGKSVTKYMLMNEWLSIC